MTAGTIAGVVGAFVVVGAVGGRDAGGSVVVAAVVDGGAVVVAGSAGGVVAGFPVVADAAGAFPLSSAPVSCGPQAVSTAAASAAVAAAAAIAFGDLPRTTVLFPLVCALSPPRHRMAAVRLRAIRGRL
jgi:hypothetical protein